MRERFDFFHRAERSASYLAKRAVTFDEFWAARPAYSLSLELPAGTDLPQALKLAYAAGLKRGSSRGGTFEIQCGRGIWSHVNERRIDGAPTDKIRFQTWDELAAEEAA